VTGYNVRAEVRAEEGYRINAYTQSFDNQASLVNWFKKMLSDEHLKIETQYISFPLQPMDFISRSDRSEWKHEMGNHIRFFHWPYQRDHVIAYAAQNQFFISPEIPCYQIPFYPLIYRELLDGDHLAADGHTAIFFIGHAKAGLAIFDHSSLINHSIISFRTAADLLYYYLFSAKEFGINPDSCTLHLVGPKSSDESLITLFDEQTNRSKNLFDSDTDAINIDLKLLQKCVL
jgi:hypothetical protein